MDENYQCLKDKATKTEQALENAKNEFDAHKSKLESIYKALNKTNDELNSIFSEIESDRKIPDVPLHEDYHKSYWKWKDAKEANENAQTAKDKYNENLNADIPDVMIQLKEVKQQNEEMKQQNEETMLFLKEMMSQLCELKKENEALKQHNAQLLAPMKSDVDKIKSNVDYMRQAFYRTNSNWRNGCVNKVICFAENSDHIHYENPN